MKKLIAILLLSLSISSAWAHNTKVSFTSDVGTRCHIYVDGILLNMAPDRHVSKQSLTPGYHEVLVKVYDSNNNVHEMSSCMYIQEDYHFTFRVGKKKMGASLIPWKVRHIKK